MGFVMTFVAQFIKTGFEVRLMLAKLKRRQNAAKIGAVATIVEQRNIPVGAEGVQKLEQRAW